MATEAEQPIDVVKTTLGGALRNGTLAIPAYQRDYSWKPERVRKLFDDFNNAMVKRQSSYFLGTVVLTPGRPPWVIDGQQRLATTCIFLAAVRDALLLLRKEKDAKSVEDDFLFKYDRGLKEKIPRLTLNIDDREYMKSRILIRPTERNGEPTKRLHSHRLLDHAARSAAERVAKIADTADTASRKVDALNAWIDFIDQSAVVVMLTPPNASRAFQMFKTLNDRAQRTTQADMIKNHLFEQAGDSGIDEAQAKWSSMRCAIEDVAARRGDDPLLTYLHHASIVFNGPILGDDIFDIMEEKIVGQGNSLRFLESLAASASDYAAIVTPSHPKWIGYDKGVSKYVSQVSQEIKMSFIRPLMLAVASRFTPNETLKAFRLLASWVIRFFIAGGTRYGAVDKATGDTAYAVAQGSITTTKELHAAFGRVVPNDIRFHEAFCLKTVGSGREARFILRQLELEARGQGSEALLEPSDDTTQITLEHILPKNPLATAGWEHFSSEERKVYCNRLGNLTLLRARDNGAIGDKPFSVKRPVVMNSRNILLTADVIERTETDPSKWTAANIAARQKMMADLAVKRWPLEFK